MAERRFKLVHEKAKRADELLDELILILGDLDNPSLILVQLRGLRKKISQSNYVAEVSKYRSRCEVPFPAVAPELYKRRANKKEMGNAFVTRVYGVWLESGFPMPLLKLLDKSAYDAFYNDSDAVNRAHVLAEAEWNSLTLGDALAPGGLLAREVHNSQEKKEKKRLRGLRRTRRARQKTAR